MMNTGSDAEDMSTLNLGEPVEKAGAETYSPTQVRYLRLLERLTKLKSSYEGDPDREDWLLDAVNKSAYSAYRSCVQNGVEAEAKALLGGPTADRSSLP